MRFKPFLFFFFLLLYTVTITAQITDLARLEYTYFPQSDSDNSFRRFRVFANVPLELKEGVYLVPGVEYRNVNLKYKDQAPFDITNLDRFQSFRATLGYTFPMKNDWRFGATVGAIVASNFSKDNFESDDLLYTGAVYFIKSRKDAVKPNRLILGLQYSTTAGRPFPLPIVNYFRRFDTNWSYTLGVPKTNLKYYIGDKSILQSFVTLDGFFANLQENRPTVVSDGTTKNADNISMTVVLAGLGYEYKITDHLFYYIYAGYTLANDIRLRDDNQDDIFTVNDANTFYARSGIKFKI